MDQPKQKLSLLSELARRKADAQKAGSVDHFGSGKKRYPGKAQPLIPRGGRNSNGKPC